MTDTAPNAAAPVESGLASSPPRVIFVCFFLSGLAGLLYQTVWIRLALARFGVTAPIMAVVLTVFMLGLAIGTWIAGRTADSIDARFGLQRLQLYALVEIAIGVGGLAVPALFDLGRSLLLSMGTTDSARYTVASSVAITAALLPFSAAMGATFPTAIAYLKRFSGAEDTRPFSYLYLANVTGALAGVLATSLVLIETLGFHRTLMVGVCVNAVIAILALAAAPRPSAGTILVATRLAEGHSGETSRDPVALGALFLTGLCSMGMELIWTRIYTPFVGTFVYSFAAILATYLVATAAGSTFYRWEARRGRARLPWLLWPWLCAASLLPLASASVRLTLPGPLRIAFGLAPFCALLGYVTPRLLDGEGGSHPRAVARAYGVNLLGCVLGPILAGFVLIPLVGNGVALLILAAPLLLFGILRPIRAAVRPSWQVAVAVVCVFLWGTTKTFEEQFPPEDIRHDHTATVVVAGEGLDKLLYVNGFLMTRLLSVTKMMVHFPMAHLTRTGDRRLQGLVVCLGMGTSLRSLASWNADATAVELVPSVPKFLTYFYPDAPTWLGSHGANVRIMLDDGRRYLDRTPDTYDFVTVDPPPPVEAAGSGLLYSPEFYASVKRRLKPGGVLQTWFWSGDQATIAGVVLSLRQSFREVRAYVSILGQGCHFLASDSPLPRLTAEELLHRMPDSAVRDLTEWETVAPEALFEQMLSNEIDLPRFAAHAGADGAIPLTDDRPVNEFFFVRRYVFGRK